MTLEETMKIARNAYNEGLHDMVSFVALLVDDKDIVDALLKKEEELKK